MPSLTKIFANIARAVGQPLHPREDIVASGSIASVSAGAWVPVDGASIATVTVSGTYTATWRLLGCRVLGGVTEQIPFRRKNDLGTFASSRAVINEVGIFEADVAGYEAVRIDATAFTSGPLLWEIATSISAQPSGGLIKPEPAILSATILGTANTATVLTLAAAGVGIVHSIRRLSVRGINASATAVAASAILQITTSNMPGSRTWRKENAFPAWSTITLVDENWPLGIRSTGNNTATSITVPALGLGVQAEITADYTLAR